MMKRVMNLRLMGLAILVSLFSLNISAQRPEGQPGQPGPGGPGRGFGMMTEDDIKEQVASTAKTLQLTDEQHKKVLATEMDFYNKRQIEFQKMRNAGGPPADREAMRETMTKMRDERNAAYESILTPAQYKQFTEMQDQRMREMREQRQQQQQQQANPGEEQSGTTDRPARGRGRN